MMRRSSAGASRCPRAAAALAVATAIALSSAGPAHTAPPGRDVPVHPRLGRLEAERAADPAFWTALAEQAGDAPVVVLLKERIAQVRPLGARLVLRTSHRWLVAVADTAGASPWLRWSLGDSPERRLTGLSATVTGFDARDSKIEEASIREAPVGGAAVRRSFELPAAPRSIAEIRYVTTSEGIDAYEEFLFAEDAPIARAVFRVQAPPVFFDGRWERGLVAYRFEQATEQLTVLTTEGTMTQLSWTLDDLPPAPQMSHAPPVADLVPAVRFAPAAEAPSWSSLAAREFEKWFEPATRPSPARAASVESIAGSGTDLERIASLYDRVRRTSAAGPAPGAAPHLDRRPRAGERERCVVLAALLRAAGFDVEPARLRPRDEGAADTMLVSLGQLTGFVLHVRVEGGVLWLDPSAGENPAGALPASRQFVTALVERAGGGRFARTPAQPAEENRVTTWTSARIATDGSATVESRALVHGEPARRARNRIRDAGPERTLEDALAACDGLAPETAAFDRAEALYEPLVLQVEGMLAAKREGGEVRFAAFGCMPAFTDPLPIEDARGRPLAFAYPYAMRDTVLVEAPDGYAVARVPSDSAASGDALSFAVSYQVSGSKVLAVRAIGILATRISPEDADSRRVLDVADEERVREIILERR